MRILSAIGSGLLTLLVSFLVGSLLLPKVTQWVAKEVVQTAIWMCTTGDSLVARVLPHL